MTDDQKAREGLVERLLTNLRETAQMIRRYGASSIEAHELEDAADEIARLTAEVEGLKVPIKMILHCPACGLQHIDEPAPEWPNAPHRSHLCHGCGHIWRPADVATEGVERIETVGKADSPKADPAAKDRRIAVLEGAAHTAWLIEWPADRQMPVRYWHPTEGHVIDPQNAIRFCRYYDAAVVCKREKLYGGARPVEHIFELTLPALTPEGEG